MKNSVTGRMVSIQERAGVLDNRAMKGTELQHRRKRLKNKRVSNTMKRYRAFGHVHNKHPIRRKQCIATL